MAGMIDSASPIEFQIQQQQIERQRAIAQALQQQAMQPEQGQMVSGHYVKPQTTQYLAKLAQALIGGQNQGALDKKQIQLAQAQNKFMGDRAAELAEAVTPRAGVAAESYAPGPDDMGPTMTVAGKPGYQPTQADLNKAMIKYLTATGNASKTPDLIIADAKQRMMSNMMGAGGAASTGAAAGQGAGMPPSGLDAITEARLMAVDPSGKMLMEARLKAAMPTDNMKEWSALGLTPQELAAAKRAKNTKEGIMEFQPGDTAKNFATGQTFVAPDFKSGTQGGFDAQGNPIMASIPGSGILAQMKGDEASAVARANANFKTQMVPTKAGDRLMTDAQAAQQATGGFPSIPPAVQAQRDQQAIEAARYEVGQAQTPQEKAQAQQVLNTMLARQSAGQSVITGSARAQEMPGIPLKSAAEKEREVGTEKMKLSVEEKRLKDLTESTTKSTKLYEQIKAAVPMAREYLKVATGSGVGAARDAALGIIGKSTSAGEAAAQLDTLAGWMKSNVPRMEGPQSNADTLLYGQMAAAVGDRAQPNAVRLKALDTLEQLQNKYADINKVAQGAPPVPQATGGGWSNLRVN